MLGPLVRPGFTPLEVLLRALASACLVLCVLPFCGPWLVRPLSSPVRVLIGAFDTTFTASDVGVVATGPEVQLYVRADLARPARLGTNILAPAKTAPAGMLYIAREVDNVFQYAALALIVVMAWPGTTGEVAARLSIALPLSMLLVLLDVPSEALGDLWSLLHHLHPELHAPESAWTFWGRLLMGGGGLALGLVVAAISITAGDLGAAIAGRHQKFVSAR
jgi:hypothetical protein